MRRSWRSLRGTLIALLLSGAMLAMVAIVTYRGGRAEDTATMYDPNDLAYLLVTVLPLAFALVMTSRSLAARVLSWLMLAILAAALLLTQSRGGLLGLLTVIVLIILFPMIPARAESPNGLNRSLRRALTGILIAFGLAWVVWTSLPPSAQQRFATLLHVSSDYNLNPNDKTGRGEIWLTGLRAFVQRPIGYGPASFEMVDLKFDGAWKAPHNIFLEVAVELGAVGLILFIRIFVLAFKGLQAAHRLLLSGATLSPRRTEQAAFARAIQFGLAGNLVSGFFLSQAYSEILWVTFGLCIAFMAITSDQADLTANAGALGTTAKPAESQPI